MRQIDIVPTLALLLGAPIPFSNLGMVITELCSSWADSTKQTYDIVKALHLNAHQVHHYLQTYAETTADFPEVKYNHLHWLFEQAEQELQDVVTQVHRGNDRETLSKLRVVQTKYMELLQESQALCQSMWAQFDMGAIVLGLAVMFKVLLLTIFLYNATEHSADLSAATLAAVTTSVWLVLLFAFLCVLGFHLAAIIAVIVCGCGVIAGCAMIGYKLTTSMKQCANAVSSNGLLCFTVSIVIIYNLSLFSNSYVVFEDAVTSFLLQSVVWAVWLTCTRLHWDSPQQQRLLLLLAAVTCCACIRASSILRACREEQTSTTWQCEDAPQPLAALTDASQKNSQYAVCVVMLLLLPVATYWLLRRWGNLNGTAAAVLCAVYGLPAMAASMALYWALQALPTPQFNSLPAWQVTLMPRLVYMLAAVIVLSVCVRPRCVLIVSQQTSASIPAVNKDNMLPALFRHLGQHWGQQEEPPLAYGLATCLSAPLLIVVVCVALLCMLLLGDVLAPAVTLLLVAGAAMHYLFAAFISHSKGKLQFGKNVFYERIQWSVLVY